MVRIKSVSEKKEEDRFALVLLAEEAVIRLRMTVDGVLHLQANSGETVIEEESYVALRQEYLPLGIKKTKTGYVFGSGDVLYQIRTDPFEVCGWKNGKRCFSLVPFRALETEGKRSVIRLALREDERIYGLGQDPMANLDQNGSERRMWNIYGNFRRSGSASIPFYSSSEGYGLLLNSAYPSRFCIGRAVPSEMTSRAGELWAPAPWEWGVSSGETDPNELSIILDDGRMDVFLFCGDASEIQRRYQDLTGAAPIPPKWAFGFIQCKNRYRTQEEVLQIAREYREKKIPCDAIVIDWQWYKHPGDLAWNKEAWPDVRAMKEELRRLGFHLMLAQHPFIHKDSLNFKEFSEKGFLNRPLDPNVTTFTYDHTNPEARKLWWSKIKKLAEDGVDAYWTDMGELQEHQPGTESYLGSRERCHNLYTTFWSRSLYEGHRQDYDTRCVSLHRSAFAGSHRYGAMLWSGDISSTWDVLRDQVVIGQTLCVSGQPYWCTDIGGFFRSGEFTPELYIRWLQWGVFCPIFRTHGTRPENEVYRFSEESGKICEAFIRLRYRLLPYIYNAAYRNYSTGKPLMRPLAFDFPADGKACACKDQYLFGDSLMVAPVTRYGCRTVEVYLPEGVWYDFWTDREYRGGRSVSVAAPLDRIPVFVRAGAVIPETEEAAHTGASDFSQITLHVYPGAAGEFLFYEDAGEGYAYEKGEYRLTRVRTTAAGEVELSVEYDGYYAPVNYTVRDHRIHKGENLSLCAMTTLTPLGAVSVDSDLQQTGAVRISVTAENGTDEICGIRCTVKEREPDGEKTVIEKEEELLPAALTGQTCLIRALRPAEDRPTARRRTFDVSVRLSVGEREAEVETSLPLPTDHITDWTVIGPFALEGPVGEGLDRPLSVEEDPLLPYYTDGAKRIVPVRSKDRYDCMGYVRLPAPPPKSYIDNGPQFAGVAYARASVFSEREQDARIEISAEPSVKVWINGEVVFRQEGIVLRRLLPDAVRLKKGENTILVKSAVSAERMSSGRQFGFTLRLTDENGNTLTNILN